MTDRWMRSPRGKILGVATGLAEWRDLPPEPVRLIVFFTILFTGFFPGALIYLGLALFLPAQEDGDYRPGKGGRSRWEHVYRNAEDAKDGDECKSTEELKAEYEELKRKVEAMESEMFDKEKEWDERFSRGE